MTIKLLMKIVITISINLFVFNYYLNAQTTLKPFSDEAAIDFELLISKTKKFLEKSEFDSARLIIEKTFLIANSLNIDTLKGSVFLKKGELEHRLSNYNKADSFYTLAIPLLKEATQPLIEVYFKKFGINFLADNLDASIDYLEKARFYIGNDTMSHKMMRYFNKRASYFIKKHEYLKGIDDLLVAKKINERYHDPIIGSDNAGYLGYMYISLGAHDLGLELYEGVINAGKKNKRTETEMYAYYNTMWAYSLKEDWTKVLEIGKKAINLRNQSKQSTGFGLAYYNLGEAHSKLNQLDSAAYYFDLGISISKEQNDEHALFNNKKGLCLLHFEQGNYALAKEYAENAEFNTFITANIATNEVLATIYEQEGNYKKANQLLRGNDAAKKEDEKKNNKIKIVSSLLTDKFEQQKKIEQQVLNQQIEQQKYQLFISILIGGLALIFVIGAIWAYFSIKKRNNLLQRDLENKKLIEAQSVELQKIDTLKSRLFANIAHELRTPLTLISGPVKQLINKSSLENGEKETLKGVLANSEQLLTMSDQIHQLSKEEVAPLSLSINQFSLHNFINYLFSKFQLLANAKGIQLKFSDLTQADILLISDAKKMEVLASNLLSNAMKFTDKEGIVSLHYKDSNDFAELIIKDTGRGIAPEDLVHIFDRYYQAKAGRIIPEGGIGIGLSICKEYAQLLGGAIHVESEVEKGTTFTFKFPKQLDNREISKEISLFQFTPFPKTNKLNDETEAIKTGDYILIVEDNLDVCNYIKEILVADYDLLFAHNGKEALRQIKKERPALIITDLMMPIMDGMDLISKIKGLESYNSIPILVLSAKTSILDELKTLRIGVDDYLTKPFDEIELRTMVYNLLNFAEEQKAERASKKGFLLDASLNMSTDIDATITSTEKNWLLQLEETIGKLATRLDLNVEEVATELAISSVHLNRKIKRLTGLTTKKYIDETRLLQARRMIENKEYDSVKAIAYSSGFSSEKIFSRKFKARFGKYPSEYLKSN